VQAQGAVPLSQLPVWTLPDDNSGLDALLHSQVRMLLFFAAREKKTSLAWNVRFNRIQHRSVAWQ
jgi:hypothetical protein